jgi:gliding motility-associated-like protein
LEPDADYVVVLGTEHDPIYGPCEFELTISGTAVDISTTTEPFLVYLGGSSQLEAFNATSYTWTPPDYLSDPNIPNPVSTPEVTTTYQVSGTIGTCEVTGEATVTVGPPIIIYDAFTPNGDNINDEWTILGMERFESSLVTVYDRWGQQIFKSTGYAKPWDGTNKGKSLPMGAYYYVIELNSLEVNIPPVTGVISIIK